MSGSPTGDRQGIREDRGVTVRLDGFAREAVEEESARLGVSVDDLVAFAVLYYLADIDSGRIARRISSSPHPDTSQ
jgi:hypothetical protein